MTAERFVDARELAEQLNVSLSTVRRLTRHGMPVHSWGMARIRRYRVSEALAWLESDTHSDRYNEGVTPIGSGRRSNAGQAPKPPGGEGGRPTP